MRKGGGVVGVVGGTCWGWGGGGGGGGGRSFNITCGMRRTIDIKV